ncbi:hypothetical protein AVEN_183876-1 [Araneus ventricosus]|uniref:Uncharacterized protein n=1 Tax=Araneus ventricosus TaxID=182803 RepID=A0A4Y2FPU9_ARAVE|nr:hypothetical protein AVEN_183876-1 [Araneus ventricosus]
MEDGQEEMRSTIRQAGTTDAILSRENRVSSERNAIWARENGRSSKINDLIRTGKEEMRAHVEIQVEGLKNRVDGCTGKMEGEVQGFRMERL